MAVTIFLLLIFRNDIAEAASLWFSRPTYSYCILILPVSICMIYARRSALVVLPRRQSLSGVLLFVVALAAWWTGSATSVGELRQFAIVAMAQGAVIAFFGWPIYHALRFPLLYLFLLVPTGTFLLDGLQALTVDLSSGILHLSSLPMTVDGVVLHGAKGDYIVAPGCAGLNFLLSSLALSLVSAQVLYRRLGKQFAWVVICLMIAVAANGLRVAGIIALAELSRHRLDIIDDHLLYGWGFFLLVMLATLAVGLKFEDVIREPASDRFPPNIVRRNEHQLRRSVGIAVLIVVSAGGAVAQASSASAPLPPRMATTIAFPVLAQGWIPTSPNSLWQPNFAGADDNRRLAFIKNGHRVDLFVAYYWRQRDGHRLLDPANRLGPASDSQKPVAGRRRVSAGPTEKDVEAMVLPASGKQRLVWSWYWLGGRSAPGGLEARLQMFLARLLGDEHVAFVAISAAEDDAVAGEQALTDFLAQAEPVEQGLAQAKLIARQ